MRPVCDNSATGRILIRYFAIRDNDGKFMGTMEESQDVTEIRALYGERRLPEWMD